MLQWLALGGCLVLRWLMMSIGRRWAVLSSSSWTILCRRWAILSRWWTVLCRGWTVLNGWTSLNGLLVVVLILRKTVLSCGRTILSRRWTILSGRRTILSGRSLVSWWWAILSWRRAVLGRRRTITDCSLRSSCCHRDSNCGSCWRISSMITSCWHWGGHGRDSNCCGVGRANSN